MLEQEYSNLELPDLFSLIDSLDWGISIFDRHGKFVWVNQYVLKHSGRPRKYYLGKSPDELRDLGVLNIPISTKVLQTGKREMQVQNSYTEEGELKTFVVNAVPIFGNDGHVKFIVADRVEVDDLNSRYDMVQKNRKPILIPERITPSVKQKPIFKSNVMKKAVCEAERAAARASVILLTGESGTGKEVFAHYIHDCSPYSEGPMIEINCASMPESLLESELFGYVKGAFTGAAKEGKIGLIEAANKGTLFLDEINSMPLGTQAKLLKVLESKTITRLGSVKPVNVDFRLVAATNRNLVKCVEDKEFRLDFYYRLNVIPINIPPLRDRGEDIILLANFFLNMFCERYELEKKFSRKVYKNLMNYSWPGNVRELRNLVERMVIMSTADTTIINEVPMSMFDSGELKTNVDEELSEKERIIHALELNGGHRENTAKYLGISRRSLQYKIKQYGLK